MAMKDGSEQLMSGVSDDRPFVAGILSDTHGYLDDRILDHLSQVDEIWHAGDFGDITVSDRLSIIKPLRGVYGNIDGPGIRMVHRELLCFSVAGIKVLMVHIGGKPGSYPSEVRKAILENKPDVFICGHSHIVKVARDGKMLHINPGAAGRHGFHQVRTMVKLTIENSRIKHLDLIELGTRSSLA